MKVCILGISHAPGIFREAAAAKGIEVCAIDDYPELVHVAEDSPVMDDGTRITVAIDSLVIYALNMTEEFETPILVSSQVPPGHTRGFDSRRIYHMAETLRIKDALDRALHPEQFVIGCWNPHESLPEALLRYFAPFGCPVHRMSYESAEFSKIAINMTLAAQVDNTNRLHAAAQKCGAEWDDIVRVLKHDGRIGPRAYLTPGRWQDSKHLLRDWAWLSATQKTT